MGTYTEIRGFLRIYLKDIDEDKFEIKFDLLKKEFSQRNDLDKPWIHQDSVCSTGSNGSKWIFIGSDHKMYDESMEEWVKLLIKNFRCDGRIEFQSEYSEKNDLDILWIISNSEMIKTTYKIF